MKSAETREQIFKASKDRRKKGRGSSQVWQRDMRKQRKDQLLSKMSLMILQRSTEKNKSELSNWNKDKKNICRV